MGDKVGVLVERVPQRTPQRKIRKSVWRQHHVEIRQKSKPRKFRNTAISKFMTTMQLLQLQEKVLNVPQYRKLFTSTYVDKTKQFLKVKL